MPVNHLPLARGGLARERPDMMAEIVRLFRAPGAEVPSREGLRPALALAIRNAHEQGPLPRPLPLDEVREGLPPGLA